RARAVRRGAQRIRQLDQHRLGGDQRRGELRRGGDGRLMVLVRGVEQGEEEERIREDLSHVRGFPCAYRSWFSAKSGGRGGALASASRADASRKARVPARGSGPRSREEGDSAISTRTRVPSGGSGRPGTASSTMTPFWTNPVRTSAMIV